MRAAGWFIFAIGLIFTTPAAGADAQCPEGQKSFDDLRLQHITRLSAKSLPEALQKKVLEQLEATSADTVGTQGATASSMGLVNRASIPSLIGAAFDNGLIKNEESAVSLNLNAFLFLSLVHPEVRKTQSLYDQYTNLRRFGGSLVFGGTGESFDRDGDGKADDPPKLDKRTDIAKLELQFRLTKGSRDLRESVNAPRVLLGARDAQLLDAQLENLFLRRFGAEIQTLTGGTGCITEEKFQEFILREDVEQAIGEMAMSTATVIQALDHGRNQVLKRQVWTLFAGRTERKEIQGRDVWTAGVRGDLHDATAEFAWIRSVKNSLYDVNAEILKAGLKYSRTPSKGPLKGCEISGSTSWEQAIDSPEAKFKTIAKANAGFSFPISKGIKLPISVSWANHKDLLTGEKDIRGHIGFTIDWSKLVEPPKSSD